MILHHDMRMCINEPDSVIYCLESFTDFDRDFSGINGLELVSEAAKNQGFESDLEMVIHQLKGITDVNEIIDKFFKAWLDGNTYYKDYKYKVLRNRSLLFISFSCITE